VEEGKISAVNYIGVGFITDRTARDFIHQLGGMERCGQLCFTRRPPEIAPGIDGSVCMGDGPGGL